VVDTWLEDFAWIDEAGVVIVIAGFGGEGGERVRSSLFEVVACSEAEALSDGRATEMGVAGC